MHIHGHETPRWVTISGRHFCRMLYASFGLSHDGGKAATMFSQAPTC